MPGKGPASFIFNNNKIFRNPTQQNRNVKNLHIAFNFLLSSQDTALHLAAKNGHATLVTYLLSHEAQNVTYNAYNQNALDVAIEAGKEPVVMGIAEHTR